MPKLGGDLNAVGEVPKPWLRVVGASESGAVRLVVALLDCNHGLPSKPQPEGAMISITIRNLDDDVKRRLCVRAAENGRLMEEARDILRQVAGQTSTPRNLGQAIHERFAALGGVEMPPVKRGPMRSTPDFE